GRARHHRRARGDRPGRPRAPGTGRTVDAALVTVDAAIGRYPFDFDPARLVSHRLQADAEQWRTLVDWFDAQCNARRSAPPPIVYHREYARLLDPTYPSWPRLPHRSDGSLEPIAPQRFTPRFDYRPLSRPAVALLRLRYAPR